MRKVMPAPISTSTFAVSTGANPAVPTGAKPTSTSTFTFPPNLHYNHATTSLPRRCLQFPPLSRGRQVLLDSRLRSILTFAFCPLTFELRVLRALWKSAESADSSSLTLTLTSASTSASAFPANLCKSVESVDNLRSSSEPSADGVHPPITPIKEDSGCSLQNPKSNLWKSVESVDRTLLLPPHHLWTYPS